MISTIPVSSNCIFACFNAKVITQSIKYNAFAIMPSTTIPWFFVILQLTIKYPMPNVTINPNMAWEKNGTVDGAIPKMPDIRSGIKIVPSQAGMAAPRFHNPAIKNSLLVTKCGAWYRCLSGVNSVARAFSVACCGVSERIMNDIVPYESKILCGLQRRSSIVFINETQISIVKRIGIC